MRSGFGYRVTGDTAYRESMFVMRRFVVVVLFAAALGGLLAIPGAAANVPPVHLSDEPAPLAVDPDQAVFPVAIADPACTPLTTGVCAELAELWTCPAGLSWGAVLRDVPSYNEAIRTPFPLAYRSTHCSFERFVTRTPGACVEHQAVTVVFQSGRPVPVGCDPAATACPPGLGGMLAPDLARIVCSVPTTPAPNPTATPLPTARPVPAFTG